jgi:hypothetical protein
MSDNMLDNKLASLVLNLHKATMEDRVKWEKTAYSGRYQIAFPKNTITIEEFETTEEYGNVGTYYLLRIHAKNGNVIEEISSGSLQAKLTITESRRATTILRDIFVRSRRIAEKVEDVVDSLLDYLHSSDTEI